jgi:uncharacterized pyridoxamine 5'-phosphate oxidase family protein
MVAKREFDIFSIQVFFMNYFNDPQFIHINYNEVSVIPMYKKIFYIQIIAKISLKSNIYLDLMS